MKRQRSQPEWVHRNRDGEEYWNDACARGWEGVITKRADAPYAYTRSRNWLKFEPRRVVREEPS